MPNPTTTTRSSSGTARAQGARGDEESLTRLLGGRASAVDASLPPLVFGVGWLVVGRSITAGAVAAVAVSLVLALWRWRAGARPLAVLASLLAVLVGSIIAVRTGNAADFFLVRFGSNLVSAVAWVVSIALRWPLLGVVVATPLGQGKRWRRDPELLSAYNWASWVWVGQYVARLAVFLPLWWANAVFALGVAQVVLTWPLVAACVAVSWWVLRKRLPDDHPGLRHPRVPESS